MSEKDPRKTILEQQKQIDELQKAAKRLESMVRAMDKKLTSVNARERRNTMRLEAQIAKLTSILTRRG